MSRPRHAQLTRMTTDYLVLKLLDFFSISLLKARRHDEKAIPSQEGGSVRPPPRQRTIIHEQAQRDDHQIRTKKLCVRIRPDGRASGADGAISAALKSVSESTARYGKGDNILNH